MFLAVVWLFISASHVSDVDAICKTYNWQSSLSKHGHSICGQDYYMTGLYREERTSWEDDPLTKLTQVECCSRYPPWANSKTQIIMEDWWFSFDNPNTWVSCPMGYFLTGIYRNEDNKGLLHNIEEGRCSKPAGHIAGYKDCYVENIKYCFDQKGWCKCKKDYYIVGLYRSCDYLYCLEELRCCKTAPQQEVEDSFQVKLRIMESLTADLALLAHYLGYGWCNGCGSKYVGENFRRDGDKWYPDKKRRCVGYMADYRLSMAFADWSFEVKDIKYGKPVIKELQPETLDSGTIYNRDPAPATKTITRTETIVRSVTHSTSKSLKNSHEFGIQVSYTPPSTTGGPGASVSYKFNYESAITTTDSTNKQQSHTFTVSTSKTLAPNSAARWSFVMTKSRYSLAYTAVIQVKFSAELLGFLRWGHGASSPNTNYHYQYRGSGDRPTFNYKFGDASLPFYTALKRQSDSNARPWLWSDMINAHRRASSLISGLSDEGRYQFTLSGTFDDVIGKSADFHWDAVTLGKREVSLDESTNSTDDNIYQESTHIARPLPQDKLSVELEPPKVDIRVRNSTRMELVIPSGD